MSESTVNFNIKDNEGKQRFVMPLVEVAIGKKTINVNATMSPEYALKLGYVVKAVIDGAWTDVTKFEAGLALFEAMQKSDDSAVIKLYMPTQYADRANYSDVKKWTLCATADIKTMRSACGILAKVAESMKALESITKQGDSLKVTVTAQPVYYTEGETANKTRGSVKSFGAFTA